MRRDDLRQEVRERLKRLPAPFDAHYGIVPLPPPDDALSIVPIRARHDAATAALSRIDTLAAELRDPYLVSRVLTRREAVSSSSIEGTNSTLDELLSAEETEDDTTTAATRQVRDYALALDRLLPLARERGPDIFTLSLLRELHRTVMRGDERYDDEPGEIRTRVVWIGSARDIAYSTYNPTPPDDIQRSLQDTLAYMRDEALQSMQQSLLTRLAVAHAHFEAVHPFRDGNGRVGRLLLPLMVAAEQHVPLYLSPYIEAHQAHYVEALKAAQQRLDWAEMTGFICDAIVGTEAELMQTRRALRTLASQWRVRGGFRKNSAAERALDLLPHYPVLTAKRLAALLGVTFAAASRGLAQLAEARIAVEKTGHARNRIFVAPEALSIINRPYGSEPLLPPERAARA